MLKLRDIALIAGVPAAALIAFFAWNERHTPTKIENPAPVAATIREPRPSSPRSVYKESVVPIDKVQPVATVNSVALRPLPGGTNGMLIRAAGMVATGGWTNPSLVPVEDAKDETAVRSFKFVATPPDGADSSAGRAVYVQLRVNALPSNLKTIRILSASNVVSVLVALPAPTPNADVASATPSIR